MLKSKTYVLWIDLLRITAMLGIILIHVAAPLVYDFGNISLTNWYIANIYDSAVRNCAPIFFMISGYLLLNTAEPILLFYKKRILKVVIPLIVWSIIYIIWNSLFLGKDILSFKSFYSIIISPAYYHLWFMYALIGVYLIVPILRIFIIHARESHKWYYLTIWFLAVAIIPIFEKYTGIKNHIDFMAISGFVGFFVLGDLLGRIKISKKVFIVTLIASIIFPLLTAYGTYFLTNRHGHFDEFLYDEFSIDTILFTITSFVVFKYIFQEYKTNNRYLSQGIITFISTASLGIYLIHPIILYYLENGNFGFILTGQTGNPVIYIPLTTIVGFIISAVIVYLLQKIPLIRRIVP